MAYNPSNKRGPFQSGEQRVGIILNRNDPMKNNRYLVQCHGADGDMGQPQWVTVQNHGTGMGGIGNTTRYQQGDQVFMSQHSEQMLSITSSYRKEGQGEQGDYNAVERSEEPEMLFADAMGATTPRQNPGEWGQPGTEITYDAALGKYTV